MNSKIKRGERSPDEPLPRLRLYVRSLSPHGCRGHHSSILDRLERFADEKIIEGYSVDIWGEQLIESDARRTEVGREMCERLDQFRDWANDRESTELCFGRESVYSDLADETCVRTVFPMMILAEYVEERLQFVSPCIEAGGVVRVTDRLDVLEQSSKVSTVSTDTARSKTVRKNHE